MFKCLQPSVVVVVVLVVVDVVVVVVVVGSVVESAGVVSGNVVIGVDGAGVDGAGVDGAGVDGAGVDGAGVDGAGVDGAGSAVFWVDGKSVVPIGSLFQASLPMPSTGELFIAVYSPMRMKMNRRQDNFIFDMKKIFIFIGFTKAIILFKLTKLYKKEAYGKNLKIRKSKIFNKLYFRFLQALHQ